MKRRGGMSGHKTIIIKEYTFWMKVLDWFITPIMWAVSGFTTDSLQKTRAWHVQKFPTFELSAFIHSALALVKVCGDDPSWMKGKPEFIFRMTILGGWKNYVVLAPVNPVGSNGWRIGWHTKHPHLESAVNKIPLYGPVKMLVGTNSQGTVFYGVEPYENITKKALGRQIALVVVDQGVNGDKKYKHLPLL